MEMIAELGGGGTADEGPLRLIARERVHQRTRELACRAGREAADVSLADYEQARRELTGEWDRERQEAKLEPIPGDEEADGSAGSDVGLVAERG